MIAWNLPAAVVSHRGEEVAVVTHELRIVPVANLVVTLAPFLLMVGVVVLTRLGGRTESAEPGLVATAEPVTVHITTEGYVVEGVGDVPCGSVDCWDAAHLREILAAERQRDPILDTVVLLPEPEVPYAVVVRTMDAARRTPRDEPLFPYVLLHRPPGQE